MQARVAAAANLRSTREHQMRNDRDGPTREERTTTGSGERDDGRRPAQEELGPRKTTALRE
jgi:hypothetical protein